MLSRAAVWILVAAAALSAGATAASGGESPVALPLPPVVPVPVELLTPEAQALAPRLIPGLRLPTLARELTRPWDERVHMVVPLPENHIDDAKQVLSVRLSPAATAAVIETGFEGSRAHRVTALSATRALVEYAPIPDWFMLRVRGAKGQTLRIELDHVAFGLWNGVHPVVAEGEDPGDPALYATTPTVAERMARLPAPGATWAKQPETHGQRWRFVDRVGIESATLATPIQLLDGPVRHANRFVIEHRFTADSMLVAMRYPYTPAFHARSLERWRELAARPGSPLRVIDLGKTRRGHPLAALVVSGPGWPEDRQRPIIAMYGREHGTEPDSSWAVHGAVEYLISDLPRAAAIRRTQTTILIPCMDPDAAGAPCYENLTHGFVKSVDECRRLLAVFCDLTDLGYRIDGVIDLHNVQGGQTQWHGFAVMTDPKPRKRAAQAEWIGEHLKATLAARGFGFKRTVPGQGDASIRFGGLMAECYGAMLMPVELNVHSRARRLTLVDAQELGAAMIEATHTWITGGFASGLDAAALATAKPLGASATVALARRTGDRLRALRAQARAMRPDVNPITGGPCGIEFELRIRRDGRLPITPLDHPMQEYDP